VASLDAWVAGSLPAFEAEFSRRPEVAALAPGRVNLIGEHTDYSEGLVLPCAIDRHTLALAAPRADERFRVLALDLGERAEFSVGALERRGDFSDYVQAVVFGLAGRGLSAGGLDLLVTSQVPLGAGLSSSAALGLAVIGAIDRVAGLGLDPITRAECVHHGESEFVGVKCGILDQFASALGRRGHALRIDCRTRSVEPVALEGEQLALLVMHSGVERALAAGAYRERVAECAAAVAGARRARVRDTDVRTLRDLAPADLPALADVLEPLLLRRARHVISENARVDTFCEAMIAGDHAGLGVLMAESQASLRDDYEVSIAELDALCEIAASVPGVVGSRLTGAGFGGCTLHLVEPDHLDEAAEQISSGFQDRFGRRPASYALQTSDGAHCIDLRSSSAG
jgi:galactokinase